MGPQLYRCGNSRNPSCAPQSSKSLQWGRNFIVAEIRLANTSFAAVWNASMGPQLYRCGNGVPDPVWDQEKRCFNGAATLSLRKFYNRGHTPYDPASFNGAATLSLRKCPGKHRAQIVALASMGPQLYRCGNGGAVIVGALVLLSLQWGRNFIVAEIIVCKGTLVVVPSLQWGRNFIVAEMHAPGRGHRAGRPCFNGAATLSLRKCVGHGSRRPAGFSLQWGRNFIVAEMPPTSFRASGDSWASMGPQLYRCGNSPATACACRPGRCFNGAATLSLRKSAKPTQRGGPA